MLTQRDSYETNLREFMTRKNNRVNKLNLNKEEEKGWVPINQGRRTRNQMWGLGGKTWLLDGWGIF